MWLALLLVVVAAVVFYLKQGKSKAKTTARPVRNDAELQVSYKALGIVCDDGACEGAKVHQGKRYLIADAPHLPLPDCQQDCQCRYEHYPDRRNPDGDRRVNFGLASNLHGSNEGERREKKKDRRKSSRARFE